MIDYLIVGHGLAGAILSQELLKANKRIMVFNEPSMNSASLVAGGLYNPITGRKMVKTWNADKLFPLIEPFYSALESELDAKFLNNIGIYRPFLSIEEQNEWQGKSAADEYAPYVEQVYTSSQSKHQLNDPFGGLQLKMAGYVDTKKLITANKKCLKDKGIYKELMFKQDQLEIQEPGFRYAGEEYQRIIFCNGYNLVGKGWFDWLPYRPVKGEILNIELDKEINTILNRGVFILPTAGTSSRVGSTYNWREIDDLPTKEGQEEIEEKLQKIYKGSYSVESAAAGIRPATKDRRPFIGLEPENENVGIFNGFGSKGVSLIPYYAKMFVKYLEGKGDLDSEVNVYRYFSLS
ncbi:MAG: FAD-dependent oxidoreductase [Cyclobacteriaceae bacterium]